MLIRGILISLKSLKLWPKWISYRSPPLRHRLRLVRAIIRHFRGVSCRGIEIMLHTCDCGRPRGAILTRLLLSAHCGSRRRESRRRPFPGSRYFLGWDFSLGPFAGSLGAQDMFPIFKFPNIKAVCREDLFRCIILIIAFFHYNRWHIPSFLLYTFILFFAEWSEVRHSRWYFKISHTFLESECLCWCRISWWRRQLRHLLIDHLIDILIDHLIDNLCSLADFGHVYKVLWVENCLAVFLKFPCVLVHQLSHSAGVFDVVWRGHS